MTEIRWYRWHINKYRGSGRTLGMSLAAHGAYRNLLDAYYLTGKLPRDRKALWKLALADSLAEYEGVADQVERMFSVSECEQFLFHDTADAEREDATDKIDELSAKRSQAGSNGAARRWQKDGKQIAKPSQPIAHNTTLQDTTVQEPKPTATRLPNDFKVTPDHRFFALENDLPSPDDHIAEFRDYWIAKPGSQGKKLDWDATFRNWLRRAKQFGPKALGGANGKTRAEERTSNNRKAILAGFGISPPDGQDAGQLPQPANLPGNGSGVAGILDGDSAGIRDSETECGGESLHVIGKRLPSASRADPRAVPAATID